MLVIVSSPENFRRSQDKVFPELVSLCKWNFSSFHNYLFYASASGSFAELNFKQVVMEVPLSSTPGYGGTQLGLRTL